MNAPAAKTPNAGYAWYVCILLTACYAAGYMDRAVINLLVIPIERQFHISDSVLGLLTGAAFALSYAVAAVPIAGLADRGDRRRLIAFGIAFWSLSTLAGALAPNVSLLFVSRICVAVGEAVLIPAATSLLADYFPQTRRSEALSVFSMGVYFGGGIALIGGGALIKAFTHHPLHLPLLGATAPWRGVLLVLGLAGLVLVPLTWRMREPVRSTEGPAIDTGLSFSTVFRRSRSTLAALAAHYTGFACISLGALAISAWAPTMFVRDHGWALSKAGLVLGVPSLIFGPLGAIFGGRLAEGLERRGRSDGKFLVGVITASGCVASSFVLTLDSVGLAIAAVCVTIFLASSNYGVLHAALTDLLPNHMRARAVAAFAVLTSVTSITGGPLIVALLTDHVFHDPAAVNLSLRIVASIAFLLAASILALGLRPYRRALDNMARGFASSPA